MAKKTIVLKIDVSKIDKSKLFNGAKGVYLDAILFLDDEADKYGNHGMVVQSVSQEEKANGAKGAILGNATKIIGGGSKQPSSSSSIDEDSLPF